MSLLLPAYVLFARRGRESDPRRDELVVPTRAREQRARAVREVPGGVRVAMAQIASKRIVE